MTDSPGTRPGIVYLVGAGPGEPGLLTLRGAACLARADLVLYDFLVNPAVLKHSKEGGEHVCLGHHSAERTMPQDEVNARMIEAARAGKVVVRLKGGSPDVFGRGAEEVEALRASDVAYEVVPGVTAGLAAAGCTGIPVTHGDHCSAVALVTGHERSRKSGPPLDYSRLAQFPGALVVYMGVTTADRWADALIRAGKSPATPTAVVRRASWPDQQTFRCTLGSLVDVIAQKRIRPPAVIIVGEVVDLAPETTWFNSRPLFGQCVLVTRPEVQADALVGPLAELGADVVVQPAIRIGPPDDWRQLDEALDRLGSFHWLVFSSSNGVRAVLGRLLHRGRDVRDLARLSLAAIGPGTAEELSRYHLRADRVPDEFRAESLAESLAAEARGQRFLLARASRGRDVLAEELRRAGAEVEQVVVYTSSDVPAPEPEVAEALAAGRIDWVTVTSSAIARSLAAMFGRELRKARLASISPVTTGTLRELGYEASAEAEVYTMEGIVAALVTSARAACSSSCKQG